MMASQSISVVTSGRRALWLVCLDTGATESVPQEYGMKRQTSGGEGRWPLTGLKVPEVDERFH